MSAAQPLPTNSSSRSGRNRRDVMRAPFRDEKADAITPLRRGLGRSGKGEDEGGPAGAGVAGAVRSNDRPALDRAFATIYFRCLFPSLVISNIFTDALPPKTALRAASPLIMRLFFLSWRPF